MSAIIITPWWENTTDFEGRVFKVRQVKFKKNDIYRSLQDGEPFEPMNDVDIRLLVQTWPKFRSMKLPMPLKVTEATAVFLTHHQGKKHGLDCYDFACMTAGVSLHDKAQLFGYWNECRRVFRRPGDVVMLMNRKQQHFRHAAIYIGHGLYLSVYGKGGDLEVTSLREMRKAYSARNIINVIPRSD